MNPLKSLKLIYILIIFFSISLFAQSSINTLNLMPVPANIEVTNQNYEIDTNFTVVVRGNPANRIYPAVSRMLRRLSDRTGIFFKQDFITANARVENPSMIINIKRPGKVELYEDESYQLNIDQNGIKLNAPTDIGALRGIETFLQLLDTGNERYFVHGVKIEDKPRFPWRGLMIDASRHFMPVNVIKRNLDGMAAVKLNVFHWHLSDDQGFRVECKTFPKLTGLGSDGLYYSQSQIKDIIQYAYDRGIFIVPEFDLPGHSTSWFVGYPEYASAPGSYTIERKFGIFNPTFNPTLEKTYKFLDKFFKEMSNLFPGEYMHIGGDENNGKQWNANPEIQAFMKKHNIPDNPSLQSYFNKRLLAILTKYHKKMVGWEEILHPGMPKSIVTQSWRGAKSLEEAATTGYQVILSKGYYIDLSQPTSRHYLIDPDPDSLHLTDSQKKLIIGGEAAMWAEFVSPETIDSRIWPRTAAIAERFWSPQNVRDVEDMYRRLDMISYELEDLGLMHTKNQAMMIRRLTGNNDVTALTNFINVIEPVKNYNRLHQRSDYTSYSPLTRVVDAAVPDVETARNFRNMVDEYLSGTFNNEGMVEQIKKKLILWKNNDTELEKTIKESPILKEIQSMSKDLSGISSIGLQALDYIINNNKAGSDWINSSLSKLKKAKRPRGQVELMIVSPIKKLVERAGGK